MNIEDLRKQYGKDFCIMEGVASADYCEWLENLVIEKQKKIEDLEQITKKMSDKLFYLESLGPEN